MPRIDIEMTSKDGEVIKCRASGWFLGIINLTNDPRPRLKKWIKEYKVK